MSTHDDDFWGSEATWSSRTAPNERHDADAIGDADSFAAIGDHTDRADHTGPLEAVKGGWNRLMNSGANATREHGIVRPSTVPQDIDAATTFGGDDTISVRIDDDAPESTPGSMWDATMFDDIDHEIEPADVGLGAIAPNDDIDDSAGLDPTVARLGAFAVIATLLIPLVFGFGSGGDDGDAVQTPIDSPTVPTVFSLDVPTAAASVVAPDPTVAAPEASPAEPTTQQPTATEPAVSNEATSVVDDAADSTTMIGTRAPLESNTTTVQQVDVAADTTEATPASRLVKNCAVDYEVVAGDFWIRIADGAGVELNELLDANGASTDTPMFPGGSICLPAGATTPAPPTTAAPTITPVTTVPATTAAPTTAAPTTAAPTTAAPTTAAPTTEATTTTTEPAATLAAGSNASADQVKQIIRDVWPDELEERAIEIAFRESRYVPTARNFCCHGVFQIYFSVHQSWLDDLGITSINDLYDPTANTRAAYELYRRAGGWGPWGF